MKFNAKDISFVVQGAIDSDNTLPSLASIRKNFPGAEIVLSTWEGSDVTNLSYDKLVLSKDPGGFRDAFATHFMNNLARQLVSTQAGIAACERKYIIKMRSDLFFHSDRILDALGQFPLRDENYSVFHNRIIACSFFTKKYLMHGKKVHPTPFHLSDWIAFGLRSDIEKLYAAPVPQEPDQATYFSKHPYRGTKRNLMGTSHQYAPEQYIFYHAVQKVFPHVQFRNYMDFSQENIIFSDQVIANNFIVMSPKELGFACLKKATGGDTYYKWCRAPLSVPYTLWKGLYRPDVFRKDYQKYCDSSYRPPFIKRLSMLAECLFKEILR